MLQSRKPVLILLLIAILSLPASAQDQSPPAPQDDQPRSVNEIRRLYDGHPSEHWLPVPTGEPDLPSFSAPATDPPDWSRLAYFSYLNNNWDIYMANPAGTDVSRLTGLTSTDSYPSLKNGCGRVAFVSDRTGNSEIWSMDQSGDNLVQLTNYEAMDTWPVWSLDKTRIAFHSDRAGNSDVYTMNADGSNLMQLTYDPAYDGQPSWSPDGTQLVFTSERSGGDDLWIINSDGSNLRRLTTSGKAIQPAWSPNGEKIAFAKLSSGELGIWQINPDGLGEEEIFGSATQDVDRWGPAWSPDGKWLAHTKTKWKKIGGQWYWTQSRLLFGVPGDWDTLYNIKDDRAWKASWASTDVSPPGPCTVTVAPQQRAGSFIVGFAAEDQGPAGVGSFDAQVLLPGAQAWEDQLRWMRSTAVSWQANDAGTTGIRCRARDIAANSGGWEQNPPSYTYVDASRPWSEVDPLPRYVRGTTVPVRWKGADQGSGVIGYDVLVKVGADGVWEKWQEAAAAQSADFTGEPGSTYHFRSQARDGAEHLEPWQPSHQAVTTFYTHVLTGTVADARGAPVPVPSVSLEPSLAPIIQGPTDTTYGFFLAGTELRTLEVSATGYGGLPPTDIYLADDSQFDLVLRPDDDVVENGLFEAGTPEGWNVAGTGAEVGATARHTGQHGLHLVHTTPATTTLSQTISIDPELIQPTLSLLYRLPDDLGSGALTVAVTGSTSEAVLHTAEATPGWAHTWADLSLFSGLEVDLVIGLGGATGSAHIDEVSVGSWQTPVIHAVSPTGWSGGQEQVLTISGGNFQDTPRVFLGSTELADVTYAGATELTAVAPPEIGTGAFGVVVANPDGTAGVLADAVSVRWHQSWLPVVSRAASHQSTGAGWPTLGHDPQHTGYNDRDPGASRYAGEWTVSLPYSDGAGMGSVAVSDGVVVVVGGEGVGQPHHVVALDASTGTEIWRLTLADQISVGSPSIAHGMVYFRASSDSSDPHLYSVDLYTGQIGWQTPFSAEHDRHLAPLVVDDGVYLSGGQWSSDMYGFHAATGQKLWWNYLQPGDCWTPAYAGSKLYTWVGDYFREHSPSSGGIIWKLEPSVGESTRCTTPVITGGTAVVLGNGTLTAVDLDAQSEMWTRIGGFEESIPVVAGDLAYAINDGRLQSYNLQSGLPIWGSTIRAMEGSPAIAGDYVYASTGTTTYVFSRESGDVVWQTDVGGWLAIADGWLYVAEPENTLHAYRAQEP